MKLWKSAVLFYLGGTAYLTLEFAWRGQSHGSMFMLGGLCFLLLGGWVARMERLPLALRAVLGAGVVTVLELLTGLLVNREFTVWDYRSLPLNFLGQICANFSLLWIPVSLAAMFLYTWAEKRMDNAPFFHTPL